MFKSCLAGLFVLLTTLSFSQVQLRLTLKDGNVVVGTSASLTKVSLTTDYGKLEIPIKNVTNIKMGVSQDNSTTTKTVDLIEIDYTYTMGGISDVKNLDVKTEYGTLTIPKDKLESIEVSMIADGTNGFKLMGSRHISGNVSGGWLNTGISIKSGQTITISATGVVTLASLSNQKYMPNGKVVGTPTSGTITNDEYGYEDGNTFLTYGNVVYKIGEQGTMMKAGDKYTGAAAESGTLYLSIYETVYSAQNTGGYTVAVEVK